MASCGRDPHPRPRRPVACRGRGAGRVRHRARALAARRDASLARRVDRGDRAQPGDRPDPPRADVRAQGRAARTSGGGAGGRGGRPELRSPTSGSRSSSRAATRPSPSRRGSRSRCGRSAGLQTPEIARAFLVTEPRSRNGSSAPSAGCARRGSRSACRPTTCCPTPPRRAPRPLPRLQRGLCGHGRRRARPPRALRGGDPAREAPLRPDARRARGVRAARAPAAPGLAAGGARRRGRRSRPPRRPGSLALGSRRRSRRGCASCAAPRLFGVPARTSSRPRSPRATPRAPTRP